MACHSDFSVTALPLSTSTASSASANAIAISALIKGKPSTMAKPHAKRARMAKLARTGYASTRDVARVLKKIVDMGLKDCDLESAPSRVTLRRWASQLVQAQGVYGSQLETIPLRLEVNRAPVDFDWVSVNPFAHLCWLVEHAPAFKELLANTHAQRPSSRHNPWNIILYQDETTPGSLLSLDHSRKLQCLYWSVQEFGHDVLCHESAWLVAGVLRSNVASKLAGGMSCALTLLL